jgi:hypothetical protein
MSSNPSNSTRIDPLYKDNYETWKIHAEALLVKHDLWEYVSGEKLIPPLEIGDLRSQSVRAREEWKKMDRKARSDLILTIHPAELQHVRGCETSNEVWQKLQTIFASKGPTRKATLLKQLALQRLDEGGDVRAHLAKFFDAVDKLSALEVEINGDLLSIMLFYSLPSSFENFRCAIESRDQLPGAEDLKVKILIEADARTQSNTQSTTDSGGVLAPE